jgi:hypothetical protein
MLRERQRHRRVIPKDVVGIDVRVDGLLNQLALRRDALRSRHSGGQLRHCDQHPLTARFDPHPGFARDHDRLLDVEHAVITTRSAKQLLGTLINEIPTQMRDAHNIHTTFVLIPKVMPTDLPRGPSRGLKSHGLAGLDGKG